MNGLIRLITSNPAKRTATSCLLVAALGIMIAQAIPPEFYPVEALHGRRAWTALRNRTATLATGLGLRQDWMMFAPNPMRENTYIDAEITYRDGRKRVWTFPQMQELGYIQRYAKERYRKFANERLWVKDNKVLWPDAARYIARLNAEPANPPQSVKLIHYHCLIPTAPGRGDQAADERWQRDVFYTYSVTPEDLR